MFFGICFLKLPHFNEIITKEIRCAIYKEGWDIQQGHSRPSLRQYLTKKNNNTNTILFIVVRGSIVLSCQCEFLMILIICCIFFLKVSVWTHTQTNNWYLKESLELSILEIILQCANKWALTRLKINLSKNYALTNHIYIYINIIWYSVTYKSWYAITPNIQTKLMTDI